MDFKMCLQPSHRGTLTRCLTKLSEVRLLLSAQALQNGNNTVSRYRSAYYDEMTLSAHSAATYVNIQAMNQQAERLDLFSSDVFLHPY